MGRLSVRNILEINTRVWLPAQPWAGRKPDLANMPDEQFAQWRREGYDAVWFMGVWEPSPASRAICLSHEGLRAEFASYYADSPGGPLSEEDIIGSPYAVREYRLNPALGRPFTLLRRSSLSSLHSRMNAADLRMILDFVPNHTATDHPWTVRDPDLYLRADTGPGGSGNGSSRFSASFDNGAGRHLLHGRDPHFGPWTDTAQLDYFNTETIRALTRQLSEIARLCDGVRCDMAMLVLRDVFARHWGNGYAPRPDALEFWEIAIREIRSRHPDFIFIAEAYWNLESDLRALGFDLTYDKGFYDALAAGDGGSIRRALADPVEAQAGRLRFIENHDEPRAAAVFGERLRAAMLLTAAGPAAVLEHDGQREGLKRKIPVQLGRLAVEEPDAELHEWCDRVANLMRTSPWADGEFILPGHRPAWDGNDTHGGIVTMMRAAEGPIGLCAANIGHVAAQCYTDLPMDRLPPAEVLVFRDLLSEARYERERAELEAKGLYLDLAPGLCHLFLIEPGGGQ